MVYTPCVAGRYGPVASGCVLVSPVFRDRFPASAKAAFDQALLRHSNFEFIPQAGGQRVKILDAFETSGREVQAQAKRSVPDSPDELLRDLSRRKITDVLPHQRECELI
jgi:hypothetical protein